MPLAMTATQNGVSDPPKVNLTCKENPFKNLCSFSSLFLALVVVLILCHSVGLFFIYTKVHKLESLEPFSLETNFHHLERHLEDKTRKFIHQEFSNFIKASHRSPESLDQFDDQKLSFSIPHSSKRKMEEKSYPNSSRRKTEEDTKISPPSSLPEPEGPGRIRREISHRRTYRSDQNDELSVQLQGQDAAEGADKSWLQLTSYARIPYNAIQEFCSKTRASCPPGPIGLKGPIGIQGSTGLRGERGDRGLPGIQGPRGPTGLPGIPGPPGLNGRKGDMGPSGIPGLDGRDGLPGEPGLDGIPGRNGLDGIPGVDGIPGFDGLSGKDGRNGTDGRSGLKGGKGDHGPVGPRGIAGPRGRMGKNGTPGISGVPGISTWHVNGTAAEKLLIPPSIPGTKSKRKAIVVREKDNLRLRCQAAGEPPPQIEWSREDGMAIATGQWKDGSLVSSTLNLTHIRRDHTGTYRCEAYNGIPPNDYKTFEVEVNFDPFVKVNNWKVGAYNGSSATLECHVEAFPVAVTYWEDRRGRILENSTKYRILLRQDNSYIWKSSMLLKIYAITKEDFGDYHCVAKNALSMTRGLVKVHEVDPNRYVPSTGTADGLTFGPGPPNYSELFNDLCPPPVECPTCPKTTKRPQSRGSLYCLRVQQFGNDTYPGFRNRTLDCELSAVGKPVYHRHTDSDYGSWMRDPLPREPKAEARYWTTTPDEPYRLYEYIDKVHYRKDQSTRNYTLSVPFQGSSHVVYNGSFFYHEREKKEIVKYDIFSGLTKSLHIPQLSLNETNFLYNAGRDFVDLITDENGLWAIYGLPDSNNTVVMKIDPWNLKPEYSWNISLSHHKFGEMFITCGVLYGIDSTTKRDTKIRFALDLYKKNILDVDLPFTNPFRKTTMLGYNPLTKEIYSWDTGNQLTYPIKYIDIGYNTPLEDASDAKSRTTLMDYDEYEIGDFEG